MVVFMFGCLLWGVVFFQGLVIRVWFKVMASELFYVGRNFFWFKIILFTN